MSVEKIIADFETCKKAAEIGLNIKSVSEARQWYVENGYLNEANRDRD